MLFLPALLAFVVCNFVMSSGAGVPTFIYNVVLSFMLITAPYPVGLCFASGNVVRSHPKLARLGTYTLVAMFLLLGGVACLDFLTRGAK